MSVLGAFFVTIFILSFVGTVHFSALSFDMSSRDAMAASTPEVINSAPIVLCGPGGATETRGCQYQHNKDNRYRRIQNPFQRPSV